MGLPLVLVPGIQGRWEYSQPAIDALGADFDVIVFEMCGERGSPIADAAAGIDAYAELITRELDRRRIDRAVICGISFGGVVAVRFAAEHPDRTRALVLASVPGPGWHLRPRHDFYARFPRIFGPVFLAETPFRLAPEISAALSGRAWWRHVIWQLRTVIRAPLSVRRMADRARLLAGYDIVADARRIAAPTLVVTGESRLDRVVPVDTTRQYVSMIPRAEGIVLDRTGHQGSVTRPREFARLIRDFVRRHEDDSAARASA